eukprot:236516_1
MSNTQTSPTPVTASMPPAPSADEPTPVPADPTPIETFYLLSKEIGFEKNAPLDSLASNLLRANFLMTPADLLFAMCNPSNDKLLRLPVDQQKRVFAILCLLVFFSACLTTI